MSLVYQIQQKQTPEDLLNVHMVRAARIELASLAWKAGILAIIRRPRCFRIITDFSL